MFSPHVEKKNEDTTGVILIYNISFTCAYVWDYIWGELDKCGNTSHIGIVYKSYIKYYHLIVWHVTFFLILFLVDGLLFLGQKSSSIIGQMNIFYLIFCISLYTLPKIYAQPNFILNFRYFIRKKIMHRITFFFFFFYMIEILI